MAGHSWHEDKTGIQSVHMIYMSLKHAQSISSSYSSESTFFLIFEDK